jgi:N utilization substance protein B
VTGRREARRQALTLLYQWDLTGQPLASLYEGDVDPFAEALAHGVSLRADALDERITDASEGWAAERLGAIERNVLRMAIYELDAGDVPAEVAIAEAVALAKRYASAEGARLVNGILARIAREAA